MFKLIVVDENPSGLWIGGIVSGCSTFFAYVGFDAVSLKQVKQSILKRRAIAMYHY
jgi:hypothetical protein